MGELTSEAARRWAHRVPTTVFTLGVALTVVGVIVASGDALADYSTSIAQATSWSSFLEAVVAGLFLGSFALA